MPASNHCTAAKFCSSCTLFSLKNGSALPARCTQLTLRLPAGCNPDQGLFYDQQIAAVMRRAGVVSENSSGL